MAAVSVSLQGRVTGVFYGFDASDTLILGPGLIPLLTSSHAQHSTACREDSALLNPRPPGQSVGGGPEAGLQDECRRSPHRSVAEREPAPRC